MTVYKIKKIIDGIVAGTIFKLMSHEEFIEAKKEIVKIANVPKEDNAPNGLSRV